MPKILGTPDDLEVSDNVTIKADTYYVYYSFYNFFHKGSPIAGLN